MPESFEGLKLKREFEKERSEKAERPNFGNWVERVNKESEKLTGSWEEDRGKIGELLCDGGVLEDDPERLDEKKKEFEKETGISYKEKFKEGVKVGAEAALFLFLFGLWLSLKKVVEITESKLGVKTEKKKEKGRGKIK